MIRQQKWLAGAAESRAGYDILVGQKAQQAVWLKMAREDLGAAYAALGDSASATRFSAELATMRDNR
jgi:hypothetical protein